MNYNKLNDPGYRQKTIEFILTGPEKFEERRRRILYDLFGRLEELEESQLVVSAPPSSPVPYYSPPPTTHHHHQNYVDYTKLVQYRPAKTSHHHHHVPSRVYDHGFKVRESYYEKRMEEKKLKPVVWEPKTREQLQEEISREKKNQNNYKKREEPRAESRITLLKEEKSRERRFRDDDEEEEGEIVENSD